jgi:DNA ligase (NAD+)
MTTTRARIDELAAKLRTHRDAYYNGQPLISDTAYDALEDELRSLDANHELLARIGAPASDVSEWEKARHAIAMGSLNKVVNEAEFAKWLARCDELARAQDLPAIGDDLFVTEKLDGISLEVIYENGQLADAITRGDGEIGERITPNVRRMKGVPAQLACAVSVSVRGEIILKLSDLKRVFPGASNPRNMAAGTSKRFDGQGCEHLSVLFYDLEGEELPSEGAKLARLAALGLTTPPHETGSVERILAIYAEYANGRRAGLDYEIDGLVVRANQTRTQHMLGEKAHRPRAAIAYKFASQAKVSQLIGISWETGASGRVSPVAQIAPVELAGAIVQRASLHNAGNVRALGIGVGDEVLVSRRNDVIPYVEEVVTKNGQPAEIPTACAACQGPLVVVGEYLLCRNPDCRALVEGRIQNWVDALGVLEWGEKLVSQLVAAGLVKGPADLYRLEVEQIAALERRGTVIATKVLDNLKAKLPIPLPVFVAALGMENVALQTAKLLISAGLDTLDKLQAATVDEIAAISGLGPAKARFVVDGLRSRAAEIERLIAVGVIPVAPSAHGPLEGKSFCFTGTLSRPRKELEVMVEQRGGTLLSSVTKGLSYLVMADPSSGSAKAEKARKYGTQCIDEARFIALMEETGS